MSEKKERSSKFKTILHTIIIYSIFASIVRIAYTFHKEMNELGDRITQ